MNERKKGKKWVRMRDEEREWEREECIRKWNEFYTKNRKIKEEKLSKTSEWILAVRV